MHYYTHLIRLSITVHHRHIFYHMKHSVVCRLFWVFPNMSNLYDSLCMRHYRTVQCSPFHFIRICVDFIFSLLFCIVWRVCHIKTVITIQPAGSITHRWTSKQGNLTRGSVTITNFVPLMTDCWWMNSSTQALGSFHLFSASASDSFY